MGMHLRAASEGIGTPGHLEQLQAAFGHQNSERLNVEGSSALVMPAKSDCAC